MRQEAVDPMIGYWREQGLDLEEFRGEWVILSGDKVLAHDPDPEVILRKAEEFDDEDIVVHFVQDGLISAY